MRPLALVLPDSDEEGRVRSSNRQVVGDDRERRDDLVEEGLASRPALAGRDLHFYAERGDCDGGDGRFVQRSWVTPHVLSLGHRLARRTRRTVTMRPGGAAKIRFGHRSTRCDGRFR